MLKKFISILGSIFFILFSTSCNEKATTVAENEKEVAQAEETKNAESELTAKEVYQKMVEASSKVKSLGVKLDVKQDLTSQADGSAIKTETKSDSKIIQEPLSLYQVVEVQYNDPAIGEQTGKIEQYLTDEGFFMYDTVRDVWGKYNTDYAEVEKQLNLQQGTNQLDSLKNLESFVDHFAFENEGSKYRLTLSGNDNKMNELVKKSLPSTWPELEQAMKSMTIHDVEYEIMIDKKTFLPSVMNVNMNIDIITNGNTILLEQNINSNYYDYNKIDEIVLPKEALDQSTEINIQDPSSI